MKTIILGHQKGGVGKSTLAFNIAYYLSNIVNKKTLLVDLDVQQTASNLNFLRKVNGFPELPVALVKDAETLYNIVNAEEYDYCVIDAGGFDADINRAAIALSNVIITPATTKITEVFGLGKFVEILDEIAKTSGLDIQAKVVLNNLHPSTKDIKIIQDLCEDSTRIALAKSIIRARAVFPGTLAAGLSVFERGDDNKAAEEIEDMVKELILN